MNRASIMLTDLSRGTVAHRDGFFEIRNIPAGQHLLHIGHIGYEPTYRQVTVTGNDTVSIHVEIVPSIFRSQGIEVIGDPLYGDITTAVERVISGHRLRQQLGRTIAETLEDEPGLAQRTMGPAPAHRCEREL